MTRKSDDVTPVSPLAIFRFYNTFVKDGFGKAGSAKGQSGLLERIYARNWLGSPYGLTVLPLEMIRLFEKPLNVTCWNEGFIGIRGFCEIRNRPFKNNA